MVGERDFAALGSHARGRTVRHVTEIDVRRHGDLVEVRVTADAFLRRMVRSIVAILLGAGRGRIAPDDVDRLLAGTGRALDGRAAPASGLTLERAVYGSAEPTRRRTAAAASDDAAGYQGKTGEQGT
jgi:tRNA pseudouridine38-40 synthase